MTFINPNDGLGIFVKVMTDNLTGDQFLSMFLIIIGLMVALQIVFRVPMEISLPVVFPLVLISMAKIEPMVAVGATILFYFAAMVARYIFFLL